MLILATERLHLRHFEPGDLDSLHALYRDAEIRRFFPEGVLSLDGTREELEWFQHGHPSRRELGLWATIERSTGTFLGRCGLLPWDIDGVPEVELAYLIDKARWCEGFATEAATAIMQYARSTLRLERLICLITPGNGASVAVARKVGMSYEREYTGSFGPCHIYSRLLGPTP